MKTEKKKERDDFYFRVTQNIKSILKYRGMTYKEIAPQLHLTLTHIGNKFSLCRFSLYEMNLLADYLEMTIDEIIFWSEDGRRKNHYED